MGEQDQEQGSNNVPGAQFALDSSGLVGNFGNSFLLFFSSTHPLVQMSAHLLSRLQRSVTVVAHHQKMGVLPRALDNTAQVLGDRDKIW